MVFPLSGSLNLFSEYPTVRFNYRYLEEKSRACAILLFNSESVVFVYTSTLNSPPLKLILFFITNGDNGSPFYNAPCGTILLIPSPSVSRIRLFNKPIILI